MFVITVVFEVRPESASEFSDAVQAQAKNSVDNETDCHLFDVCRDSDRPDRFFLYEIYSDEAAFDAHLESVHFKDFDQKVAQMVVSKSVERWNRL